MGTGSICRSLFVAGLLAAATGCFAVDELDKASALSKGPPAKSAAEKPGSAATTVAKPAVPNAKGWWQTARTLGSDKSDEAITRCEVSGRSEFMLRDDCVARGGVPK